MTSSRFYSAGNPRNAAAVAAAKAEPLVLLTRHDRVAVITLNDPKRLNALNADMGDEFAEVVKELCDGEASRGLGAVVLTGCGRAFSAGSCTHMYVCVYACMCIHICVCAYALV